MPTVTWSSFFLMAQQPQPMGCPYRNTYTWYFEIRGTTVVNAIAFFETRDFDAFWMRVKPDHSSRT